MTLHVIFFKFPRECEKMFLNVFISVRNRGFFFVMELANNMEQHSTFTKQYNETKFVFLSCQNEQVSCGAHTYVAAVLIHMKQRCSYICSRGAPYEAVCNTTHT